MHDMHYCRNRDCENRTEAPGEFCLSCKRSLQTATDRAQLNPLTGLALFTIVWAIVLITIYILIHL